MSLSATDYNKLYKVQDQVLALLKGELDDFYLTGGTALGRYYLHHRYSDDLDFFTNRNEAFGQSLTKIIRQLRKNQEIDESRTLVSEDFVRILLKTEPELKLEFVNDVSERWGTTLYLRDIPLDNPANILANKLTALVSRDEPKDVVDIVSLAGHYAFHWNEIFHWAFQKQILNETDIAMRLASFPKELINGKPWLDTSFQMNEFAQDLNTLTNDFLLCRDNSLGTGKTLITEAKPNELVKSDE
jgi:predicted nucleotidyltransferase component of viral defense system